MLSQLCTSCRKIYGSSIDEQRSSYFQGINALGIETAAIHGCHPCTMFAGQIENFRKGGPLNSRDPLLMKITSMRIGLQNDYNIAVGDLISLTGDQIPRPKIGGIMDRTDSDASFENISKWLSDCRTFHPSCHRSDNNRVRLPTRLLKIRSSIERGHKIQLCVSTYPRDTQYTTLSHCWGALEFLKLNRANLESFEKNIPMSWLPLTFRDAISISCRLGFEYLWIDSLCIIQDDPEDWQRESVLMESVYGGSSLNIAASAASDGSKGCFVKRTPYRVEVCRLTRDQLHSDVPVLHHCLESDFYSRNIVESPLNKRAWVFQELYLAPRTVSFGSDQIFWKCRQLIACEGLPDGIPPILLPSSSWRRLQEHDSDPNKLWTDIVSSYSSRQLTRETDKLVALSGVARQFMEQFNGRYLAGLWKENIIEQLAWYVSTWAYTRPRIYRAPSWSWASVDGKVSFRQEFWEKRIDHIRFIDAHVSATKSGPFGEADSAFLQLLSRALVKARVDKSQDLGTETSHVSEFDLPSYNVWFDTESYTPRQKIYCLPLYENNTHFTVLMIGLLVEAVKDEPGTFRRVGRFRIQEAGSLAGFEKRRDMRTACAEDSLYQLSAGVDERGKQLYILKLI